MKNWIRNAAVFCWTTAAAITMSAQQPQGAANPAARWLTVNYTRVSAANAAEYEKLVQSELAKVVKARIELGEIESWTFQRALLPSGTDADYTHSTVVVWKNKPILGAGNERINRSYAKAGVDRAAYTKKRDGLGAHLVRTQVVRRIDGTSAALEVGDLVRIDSKVITNPTDSREYVDLERNVYKATHERRVQNGALKQWSLFAISLPGGPEPGAHFATAEVFKDEDQMFQPPAPGGQANLAMRNTQVRMNAIAKQKPRRVHRVLAVVR